MTNPITSTSRRSPVAAVFAAAIVALASTAAHATVTLVGDADTSEGGLAVSVSAADLLNGLAASASSGNFALETSGGTPVLTNGVFGPLGGGNNSGAATGGNTGGTSVTYTLGANPYGYRISNINTFVGWSDAGRNDQVYTFQYSLVGDPTFKTIYSVSFGSGVAAPSATSVAATDSNSLMASNVDQVRVNFGTVENGYTGYRELDVFGSPDNVIVQTFAQNSAYTVASGDLLETSLASTQFPVSPGPGGLFAREGAGGAGVLNNGSFGPLVAANPGPSNNSGSATIGVNEDIIYLFDLVASPLGYEITGIDVYAGWGDTGRDDQGYTVLYSTVDAPNTFIALATVDAQTGGLPNTIAGATKSQILAPSWLLASGVAKLYFDFDEVENGYTGYREIDVHGYAVPTPAALPAGIALMAMATIRRRR